MARYRESVCRLCRREGMKLFLKGERCNTSKCALERRSYAPGQHGQRRKKLSTYGIQLREKQKAKRIYGIMERQFRRYFEIADRYRGVTGTVLLQLLERRLDNVVFRLGFAPSRGQARQLVCHGHIKVDDRKVDIPSYLVKEGQVIAAAKKMGDNLQILRALEVAETQGRSPWLEFDKEAMQGKLAYIPSREEIPTPIKEQLIVELYSK